MKAITVSNLFFRRFGAAALVAFMAVTAAGTQVQAQTQVAPPAVALPDFTGIVEKVEPAVVNIRTTATVPVRGGPGGGNDPYELFRCSSAPISSRPARRPASAASSRSPSLKSAPFHAAWGRASSSRPMATS